MVYETGTDGWRSTRRPCGTAAAAAAAAGGLPAGRRGRSRTPHTHTAGAGRARALLGHARALCTSRGGRVSTGPCTPVTHGAAGVSGAFGEGGGADIGGHPNEDAVMRVVPGDLEKNRGRPRSDLGSTVEYSSDLRLSGHPQLVLYNMVWLPGRVAVGKKAPCRWLVGVCCACVL